MSVYFKRIEDVIYKDYNDNNLQKLTRKQKKNEKKRTTTKKKKTKTKQNKKYNRATKNLRESIARVLFYLQDRNVEK